MIDNIYFLFLSLNRESASDKSMFELFVDGTKRVVYTDSQFSNQNYLHIVVVVSVGSNVLIFVNGTLSGQSSWTVPFIPNGNLNNQNFIGASLDTAISAYPLAGKIYEFRVWSSALSTESVISNFNCGANCIFTR